MKHFIPLVLIVCATLTVGTASAQKSKTAPAKEELRIAVVDIEKVAKELPEALEADKKLTDLKNKFVDSIKVMEQKFKDKYEAYNKNKSMMTAEAQRKEEDELRGMQMQYSTFQEENFGAQGLLAQKRTELLKPVIDKIQDAIRLVAKEENLTMVFNKNASDMIVYSDDHYDITHKIIDRMKRGK